MLSNKELEQDRYRQMIQSEPILLQAHRNTLRTNTQGIHLHAVHHQRTHLDRLNVNATSSDMKKRT
jgi:hypothetical protein